MTFNNHKGFSYDAERASAADGSHPQPIGGWREYAGAQFSLGYYWNFEKVGEYPNDFLRFMVMYAFRWEPWEVPNPPAMVRAGKGQRAPHATRIRAAAFGLLAAACARRAARTSPVAGG